MTQRMGGANGGNNTLDHVVDFNQVREQKLEEKRRNTERIFFRNLISVYSVISHSKMTPIDLIDVSEEGCSFQVPFDPDRPWPVKAASFPIRLYFSQDTYLEVLVHVQNKRHSIESQARYIRFGCSVDQSTQSYPAYRSFVAFLKAYSEHAHKDLGDVSVFYL